jgi:hypothetical protein
MGLYQITYRICETRTGTIDAPSEFDAGAILQKNVFSQSEQINTFEICHVERLD